MDNFLIRTFTPDDTAAMIDLWGECGLIVPWNNPETDIKRKHEDSPRMFFVGTLNSELVASCMAGYDGHRGWIYFMAVRHAHRGNGFASMMVEHAEKELIKLGCPKVELLVREKNSGVVAFYRNIGFDPEPVIVLSKRLIEDKKHDFG